MKNNKIVGLVVAVGMLAALVAPAGEAFIAKAETVDLADQCFMEFVLSDTDYEGEITYTHSPLYNEDLEVTGRQYNFTVGDVEGYALLAEIEGVNKTFYEVEELFYNETSPFDSCEGLPIYITYGMYLDYKNGSFYDVETGNQVDGNSVELNAYKGFGYRGLGHFVEQTQTVTYASKSTSTYSIEYDLPNYYAGDIGVTSCANTAGAILLGYYDRFYENLIPNFKSYITLGTVFRYRLGTAEITDLINELYILMGTDVNHQGTRFSEFQDGMQQYVSDQGYSYETTNMFSWGSFDFNKYKTSVEANKPVAIFSNGYAMVNSFTETPPTETISNGYDVTPHVLIGCGYKVDTYYNSNGSISETRKYLKVASGLEAYGIGYLNINGLGQIMQAISVEISEG